MNKYTFIRIFAVSTIMMILLLLPVIAFAGAVPWISENYTAYACASFDGFTEAACYGSFESYAYGPPLPISISESTPEPSPHPTVGSSSITSSDMTVYSNQNHGDERGVGRADFSGTYNAISPYPFFLFSYELSGFNDAWLTITDQTSGTVLGNYTLLQTSKPVVISVSTTSDHLISVDFGIEGVNGGYGTLSYTTAVAPEPISSLLFITGGTLLVGRRFLKRKK